MEQENNAPTQNPSPVREPAQPVAPVAQGAAQAQPAPPVQEKKGTPVWVWLLGGCFLVCLLAFIGAMALGWWGVRKVKHEIKKYEPGMEQVQQNLDKFNKEADEWQKKSEEMRNSMPDPEDYTNYPDNTGSEEN